MRLERKVNQNNHSTQLSHPHFTLQYAVYDNTSVNAAD